MNIVVIGGGAGGLELVSKLGKQLGFRKRQQNHHITLIDCNDTHLWKPLLHEVAAGSLDAGVDALSYRAHAFHCGFDFQLGKVVNIHRQNRQIELAPLLDEQGATVLQTRYVSYDYVVFALGSICNDFDIAGVNEHCIFLDNPKQASELHKHLMLNLLALDERLKTNPNQYFTLSIVGAGATGVELSAELFHAVDSLKVYGLKRLTHAHLKVNLIEAGPRILPALPQRISDNAKRQLERLGVNILTNVRIVAACKQGLVEEDESIIHSDIMLWAAGVKAPDFMQNIGQLATNSLNQLIIGPTLQSISDERVFAIGDCAALELALLKDATQQQEQQQAQSQSQQQDNQDGSINTNVPATAKAAHQMAKIAYKNLCLLAKNNDNAKPLQQFNYKDYGSLISLSHYDTLGTLISGATNNAVIVEGKLARLMYLSLYRLHQLALFGLVKTLLITLSSRINKVIRPRLKMH